MSIHLFLTFFNFQNLYFFVSGGHVDPLSALPADLLLAGPLSLAGLHPQPALPAGVVIIAAMGINLV
jgi:hypothetical protein